MFDSEGQHGNAFFAEADGDAPTASSAAWAFADLAFMLLIAFVLGAVIETAWVHSLEADNTAAQGPELPRLAREIRVQVLYRPDTDAAFEVVVESIPPLSVPTRFQAGDLRQLGPRLRTLTARVKATIAVDPSYGSRFIFLSAPEAGFGPALKTYAALRDIVGEDWFVGIARSTARDG